IKKNLTYPCFCSDEELALERKLQLSQGQAPRYRGTCLSLSAQEIEQRLAKGLKPTLRFRVPAKETILFQDLIKGPQSFNSADIGDFIIRRADGSGSFMFCNAIDDALMMVTQVLRGEDHLANTPRQLLLMKALGLHQPQYGHLAMITSEDGRPLSKREGSLNLRDLRERGYLSEALINYLGRLGHSYETSNLLSFEELAKHFQLKKISHSAARFDLNQLLYWQKIAVNALDTAALWKWLGEDTQKKVPENKQTKFAETVKPNLCFPEDAAKWAEIFFQKKLSFTPEDLRILREAGEQFFVEAEQALEVHGSDFKNIVQDIKKALKVSGKNLYMPLRIALTGQQDGPELVQIAELLGREGLRERFSHAFQIASGKQDAQTL
ncbi:MAG TPA: glutamate--tRNA ligase, partial [Gammaproteobacteria bacterium]|nr:glutamate--tRNA ligase [Gammaproteobacteria bacterium]